MGWMLDLFSSYRGYSHLCAGKRKLQKHLWTANQIAYTITSCKILSQTNSLKQACCFAIYSLMKLLIYSLVCIRSYLKVAHAFSKAAFGMECYISLHPAQ